MKIIDRPIAVGSWQVTVAAGVVGCRFAVPRSHAASSDPLRVHDQARPRPAASLAAAPRPSGALRETT